MSTPEPCRACPWRTANQGTRHPAGWYTKTNLARLWAGLRRGEDMSCHPTDPNNPVPDGVKAAPAHSQTRECAGALILKQREIDRLQREHGSDLRAYRRARPFGLTVQGIGVLVNRVIFGGTPLGGLPMPTPNLNEPAVQYEPLGTWTPPEGSS